jgi:putative membrane protein
MSNLIRLERACLYGHILSMAFGLAGLLWVLPHPELIATLPDFGKVVFGWSMAGGGVVYMVLGIAAVAIYAYRSLGLWHWLSFMIPAIALSLGSELLGTSTGFPFGHYRYLSGLGYKIAGLVPFTIPLSWYYLGFSAYLIVRVGLSKRSQSPITTVLGAIILGSVLLTSWDFVLDPAMSQTAVPFWVWEQPGAFFGMPYENFAGWFGTGAVFMTVASLFWRLKPLNTENLSLNLPLTIYLSNFTFATVMSLGAHIYPPIGLGLLLGVIPAVIFYQWGQASEDATGDNVLLAESDRPALEVIPAPISGVGALPK